MKRHESSSSSPDDIRPLKRKLDYPPEAIQTDKNANLERQKMQQLENMGNHDLCDACGGVGQFLCCDACPNAFHFSCVEPPMDSTDVEQLTGKWFCNECEYKQGKPIPKGPKGLFKQLVEDISIQNPKSYKLPDEIIDFFQGVTLDDSGNYIDTTQIKPSRYKNGNSINPDILDYSTMKDKNGKFIRCYHCRKIAFKKLMIACDYCSLYWHLDCLTPPMAGPPNSSRRWRCPNHIENVIKPTRQQKHPEIIHVDHSPCVYKNYFNIIIKEEQEQEEKEPKPEPFLYLDDYHRPNVDILVNKDGTVYMLPEEPIQFDTSKSQDESVTTSEVSTPITFFSSPEHNKDEIDTWLNNMAHFHSGKRDPHLILSLIKDITSTKSNISPSSSPIPSYISKKYQKYQKIEHLLKQKDEQELLSLICKNIK
ncbi:hypothetical protein BCV72DRAFT_332190 [Rhizopus microsporus var. microsporus]|uniref:PHD-type domain-containing protein n=1 Tax=Rhizopus microsporus var. microsporus TaxID=86635 RepID=A0A1X0RI12_RHIZD|nr:hypothetical protein BCV72DRAFT_332190 [Rhizopus microsporus var. microsporus]